MSRWIHALLLLLVLILGTPAALAQISAQEVPTGRQPDPARQISPPSKLGLRAEIIRNATTALNTVVIVPDGASYLEAIARWQRTVRFPVLIDDGSVVAREDIARFVRAYKPQRVVRWKSDGSSQIATTNSGKRAAIESALLTSWGFTKDQTIQDLYSHWRDKEQFAPGIVVAHPGDSSWPAAIALASFRAQPIAWATSPRDVNGRLAREQVDALSKAIETECEALGFAWPALGDQIDAVALCLQTPAKYLDAEGEIRAVTDRLGRHADDKRGERRWAFVSQIFGNESRSAYTAMSGLFLSPRSALLFDGYENKPPYSNYELESLKPKLDELGATVRSYASPRNGRDQWLIASARAVDAALIFVNTHGMRDAFNLSPGRLRPGTLPTLTVPAMVHFVHSWSAVRPNDRATVAGRWFERGVYAYYGSVNEPYLQAFVPPELVMSRLRGAFPWSAAVRVQDSQVWKLACFGDPLIVIGQELTRSDTPPELPGAQELNASIASAASGERFDEAFELLSLMGRDQDALRLWRALDRDRPRALSSEIASSAVFAIGRAGTPSEFFEAYARLDEAIARDPYHLDYLWNLTRLRLNARGEDDRALIAYLRLHLREDQRAEDAADLAMAIASLQSVQSAREFLDSIEPRNQRDRKVLADAKRRITAR